MPVCQLEKLRPLGCGFNHQTYSLTRSSRRWRDSTDADAKNHNTPWSNVQAGVDQSIIGISGLD
eukprot:5061768-Amphidinium_carterae.1